VVLRGSSPANPTGGQPPRQTGGIRSANQVPPALWLPLAPVVAPPAGRYDRGPYDTGSFDRNYDTTGIDRNFDLNYDTGFNRRFDRSGFDRP
jgi:hypothetical protein